MSKKKPGGAGDMTVREAGMLGGKERKDSGADYSAMGKAGGEATKKRHGREHYVAIGQKGGEQVKKNHGPDFYSEIGRKGGLAVKELVARGKALQAREALAALDAAGTEAGDGPEHD